MHKVAPVNLPYNIKTLWFDPGEVDAHARDKVVVQTTRGLELGVMANDIIEVADEEIEKLKSPLMPVERIATEEDVRKSEEMERLAAEAMPVFRRLARETNEEMHPVSVEYMLDGDKAIFYFEAEDRIDFRDLVRKLASEFHVRIDMRQIGVRDEARIVGGIAHCGQIVCCKRLGGEFKPVSIRMAKDQDLSLNPQKISGLCGRLMCCLRYENAAYKEFKSKAPRLDARIETPAGEGRVIELDVPRELVGVKVGDEKPVKLPLAAFSYPKDDHKFAVVDPEQWEVAVLEAEQAIFETVNLFQLPKFTGEDKLGSAKAVHHDSGDGDGSGGKRRRRGSGGSGGEAGDKHRKSRNRSHGSGGTDASAEDGKRKSRRRSTKIKAEGEKETTVTPAGSPSKGGQAGESGKRSKRRSSRGGKGRLGAGKAAASQGGNGQKGSSSKGGADKRQGKQGKPDAQGKLRPGHKSSGLSHEDAARGPKADGADASSSGGGKGGNGSGRRRRRRRKSSGAQGAQGASQSGAGQPPRPDGGQQ